MRATGMAVGARRDADEDVSLKDIQLIDESEEGMVRAGIARKELQARAPGLS